MVLVFGESLNDSDAIRHLLIALNPALDRRVRAVPRPVSLTRGAGVSAVRDWVVDIGKTIRATEASGPRVVAALVHRDADGPDPQARVEARLRADLAPLGGAHAVVPVQMIEAWWFLFPEAVKAVRPGAWRGRLPRTARDVEVIDRPKAELQRLTRAGHTPRYAEADSRVIAEHVRLKRLEPLGTSRSYDRFSAIAKSIG